MVQICSKSFVGWGFAPDPTEGAYSAPPDPLAALRGPTSKGKGGREGRGWRGGEARGEEGKGGEGEKGSRREGSTVEKILILRPALGSKKGPLGCREKSGVEGAGFRPP